MPKLKSSVLAQADRWLEISDCAWKRYRFRVEVAINGVQGVSVALVESVWFVGFAELVWVGSVGLAWLAWVGFGRLRLAWLGFAWVRLGLVEFC